MNRIILSASWCFPSRSKEIPVLVINFRFVTVFIKFCYWSNSKPDEHTHPRRNYWKVWTNNPTSSNNSCCGFQNVCEVTVNSLCDKWVACQLMTSWGRTFLTLHLLHQNKGGAWTTYCINGERSISLSVGDRLVVSWNEWLSKLQFCGHKHQLIAGKIFSVLTTYL
jgi:hypothetical protein